MDDVKPGTFLKLIRDFVYYDVENSLVSQTLRKDSVIMVISSELIAPHGLRGFHKIVSLHENKCVVIRVHFSIFQEFFEVLSC